MSKLLTEERLPEIPAGARVVVRKEYSGGPYIVRGRLLGFTFHPDGPAVRVLPDDRIERVVPMPARVTLDAR